MSTHVHISVLLGSEAFETYVALELLFVHDLDADVVLGGLVLQQVLDTSKRSFAHLTLELLACRVQFHMLRHVVTPRERLGADGAHIRLVVRMNRHVSLQMVGACELLLAYLAIV